MESFRDIPGYVLPLIAAILAGGLIGLEREWRGRAAGFRTHILVCLASAVLMEAAVMQGLWRFQPLPSTSIVADPTRMAHGVLTGIGFLCAGVIFRSGFSIHGLTTAASLWITAAIGVAFGAGLYGLGGVATALTAAVLTLLRLVSARMPEAVVADVQVEWRSDEPDPETAVRSVLSQFASRQGVEHHALVDDGRRVALRLRLSKMKPDELAELGRRLRGVEGVLTYTLDPRDD